MSARATKEAVEAKPGIVVAIVDAQVTAHPDCACEIVKTAIIASKASSEEVARIVEAGVMAAPEHMRLIAQCALAVAPDALPNVQAVLANLDPAAGGDGSDSKSSKDSKDAKDAKDAKEVSDPKAEQWDPLVFIGPMPGFTTSIPPVVDDPGGFPATNINPPSRR